MRFAKATALACLIVGLNPSALHASPTSKANPATAHAAPRAVATSADTTAAVPVSLASKSAPRRWKPSSHVYLALEALKEIFSDTDLLGNPKSAGKVPVYRVLYKMPGGINPFNPLPTDRIVERIGEYALHPDLEDALRNHTESFIAGVVGPDAYPDLATGQTRVHVDVKRSAAHDVPTDAWFEYLWTAALDENPGPGATPSQRDKYLQNLAFVAGYLTHGAGDMYMHTFINLFAGGAFSIKGTDNGIKHLVSEGYVGKRTPSLDVIYNELKDLGLNVGTDPYRPELTPTVFDFIYRHLTDAMPGTTLGDELLVDISVFEDFDPSLQASFPRWMSSFKHGLVADTTWFRNTIVDFDEQIEDADPANAALLIAQRTAFVLAHEPRVAYARNWIDDIELGLRAWPEFHHKVMQGLTLSRDGTDIDEITAAFDEYQNDYLLSMLGSPDVAGDILGFIAEYQQMIWPQEYRDAIQQWKEDFIDAYLLAPFGLSLEEIHDIYKNPELQFNPVVNTPDPLDSDGVPPLLTDLESFNRDYLFIDDDGYQNPALRFSPFFFQPAYNTITMTKLLMIAPDEIDALQQDLMCDTDADCDVVPANAILGYINSLDEDNEFRKTGGIYADRPANQKRGVMPFVGCEAYRELFMEQPGEQNPCNIQAQTPAFSIAGGTYTTPQEVSLSHPHPDAVIYYGLVDRALDQQEFASAAVRQYTGPFTIPAPLEGEVRPWTVAARAFVEGWDPSEIDTVLVTIDAQLPSATFFPDLENHTQLVNVTLSGPAGSSLFYTINGSTPTYNSTRYTGPIALGIGSHTIRATAYRIGYTQSPVVTKTYNVYSTDAARAADPVFKYLSHSGFAESVEVEMSTTTQNAVIRYTVAQDGVPPIPTEASTAYSQPFDLGVGNWFVRAIAFKNGLPPSNMVQVNYGVNDPLGTTNSPVFSPPAGIYNNDVQVTLEATTTPATAGVRVFYSTDGSEPPISPVQAGNYSGPFTVTAVTTVKAQATRSFFPFSDVSEATYTLRAATPDISPDGASSTQVIQVSLTTATENAEIRYTLDGSDPNESATLYNGPIELSTSATLAARAFRDGYEFSAVARASFTVTEPRVPTYETVPVDAQVEEGGEAIFTIGVSGSPAPTIEWLHNDVVLEGETNDTLRIAPVLPAHAGRYQARATNQQGVTTSDVALLEVFPTPVAPSITQEPEDIQIGQDSLAAFVVSASGVPTPTYQWLRNGTALLGQTGPSLVFPSVTLAMAGEYRVVVANQAGSDSSRVAMLTVVVSTGLEAVGDGVDGFELGVNYPNPFSNTTRIPFSIPEATDVQVTLYDLQGRRLAILVDDKLPKGRYELDFDASGLASGVYFYRLEAGTHKDTGTMTLVR